MEEQALGGLEKREAGSLGGTDAEQGRTAGREPGGQDSVENQTGGMAEGYGKAAQLGKGRRKRRLTGSLAAKVAVFILLVAFLLVGAGAATLFVVMADYGFYSESRDTLLEELLHLEDIEAVDGVGHIDMEVPAEGDVQAAVEIISTLYANRAYVPCLGLGGLLLCVICFVFLMSSAGRRNGQEGIMPGVLTGIHLDVLTLLFGGAALVFTRIMWEIMECRDVYVRFFLLALWGIIMTVWLTLYFMDFAIRVKRGKCWRHTLVYSIMRGIWHALRFLCRVIAAAVRGIPMVLTTLLLFLGLCIVEFFNLVVFGQSVEGLVLWLVTKAALLAAVVYVAWTCVRLLEASRALAEGREDYVVDTSKMFGDFREHGENLNSLGKGISRAVAERMKSEHLKTELITNVSHDIKTPLTSIINYADLIYEEAAKSAAACQGREGDSGLGGGGAPESSMGRIEEYSQVLLRQSRRMKKLLEDLVEASKATTGNLEVNLEPCEAGVLLSQAVGEYQQKMEEKGLELISRQPQEPVRIMADGRRLWRVFDNLLNNICKYAQENTRVYLSIETGRNMVMIIFRNMSKYPLDISGEELEERFVRGDKARHMEGNGLGLSIAKSLVELQRGRMEIIIDGDLFKVTLTFPVIP